MSLQSIVIRRAGVVNAPAVAPLFDAYRQFYQQAADFPLALDYLTQRLARAESVVLVAEWDGRVVGFTQLYPSFCSVAAAPILILYDLFVALEARQQGVGRRLMEAARVYAMGQGAQRLELATAVTNTPAQCLYESLGYQKVQDFYHYELPLAAGGEG